MEVGLMYVASRASVILVRHGRTLLNAENRLRGRLDPPLDDVGLAEVQALAEDLAARHPARVVTSPLRRAMQTAEAIVRRTGATMEVSDGLLDRDYGQWAGHPIDELVESWGSVDGAPGVEPTDALLYRACVVLDQQLDFLSLRPVVLVAHDALNRVLLAHLDPSLGPANRIEQRTACWNDIVRIDGNWHVQRVDQKPTGASWNMGDPAPSRDCCPAALAGIVDRGDGPRRGAESGA
jgi:broad specificity phosphatase PhoE